MMLFMNLLTVILLALVAGLLLVVGQQVRVWRQAAAQSPLLAEQLATQLLAARQGVDELRKQLTQQGPELQRLMSDGAKLHTELQYLLERADKAAARLDLKASKSAPHGQMAAAQPSLNLPAEVTAAVEQVAGANGHAIQPTAKAHDPLEELLATLQTPAAIAARATGAAPTPAAKPAAPEPAAAPPPATPKLARRGPITAAELALAQRVAKRPA